MAEIVTEKFKDPTLRKRLLDMGDRLFVECTKDKKCGADATLQSNITKEQKWPGKNTSGIFLMKRKPELKLRLRQTRPGINKNPNQP